MSYASSFLFINMDQSFTDTSRKVIAVTGDDAGQFLQGLITNDIGKAKPDAWLYALVLTAQGKIIADAFIQTTDGGYLLDCPGTEVATLLTKLRLYRLRSKVNIEERDTYHILLSKYEGQDDPRHPDLWKRSLTTGVLLGNNDPYHTLRIQLLVPDFAMDLWTEKFYPHELGMNNLNAIDYKKGCYVGQEVTARVEYRGVVRKKLHLLHVNNATKGEAIMSGPDNKEIGLMLGHSDGLGLALLREDELKDLHTTTGAPLTLIK